MQPDFVLEGELKGVTVKANHGDPERLVLTLTGQREDLSDPEIQQAMDTGSVYARRMLELVVEAGPRFEAGWVAGVAVKAHPEHGTVLTWRVSAEVRLDQLADMLGQLVSKQGEWIRVSGRLPRRQMSFEQANKAFTDEVADAMRAHGVPVVDAGGAA